MVTIIKEEIEMEEALKNKINFLCDFCKVTPVIKIGCIRRIDKTNLTYVEPHRIIIKNVTFLVFNYESTIYIENLSQSVPLKDLEKYIKSLN